MSKSPEEFAKGVVDFHERHDTQYTEPTQTNEDNLLALSSAYLDSLESIEELEQALRIALEIIGHPDDLVVKALWSLLQEQEEEHTRAVIAEAKLDASRNNVRDAETALRDAIELLLAIEDDEQGYKLFDEGDEEIVRFRAALAASPADTSPELAEEASQAESLHLAETALQAIEETKDGWNRAVQEDIWANAEARAVLAGCVHDIAVLLEPTQPSRVENE